jgi:hypothetical protein
MKLFSHSRYRRDKAHPGFLKKLKRDGVSGENHERRTQHCPTKPGDGQRGQSTGISKRLGAYSNTLTGDIGDGD